VEWFVRTLILGGSQVPIARLQVELFFPLTGASIPFVDHIAWVDTCAPLGLIPYRIHQAGVPWRPLPGVQTTWNGHPCDVGSVDVWLIDVMTSSRQGPFPMLAKFLRSEPPGSPPPLLMGLEFFLAHHASFTLDPPPGKGAIRTP
jgi:hypothetical protein